MKQATANRSAKVRGRARKVGVDFGKLETIPILKRGEPWISLDEALRRARKNPITNHGKRFAMKLADDLNGERVLCKNWRIWQYVIFAKGSWRNGDGFFAWFVIRRRDGFCCGCFYFSGVVVSIGRLLRPCE